MNCDLRTTEMIQEVYKKTFVYELEKEDGSTTHLHSDKFLDDRPERRESPEFTEEEEKDQARFVFRLSQALFGRFGSLWGRR